jgi:hypothetical protein
MFHWDAETGSLDSRSFLSRRFPAPGLNFRARDEAKMDKAKGDRPQSIKRFARD